MNQILSTDNNQKKQTADNLIDMRKIMIIFSIILVIFALVIVGIKISSMVKEKHKEDSPIVLLNQPTIEVNKIDRTTCLIEVKYDDGIESVSWWWNVEDEPNNDNREKYEYFSATTEGSTYFDKQIEISQELDENILYIKAVGENGSEKILQQSFVKEADTGDIKFNILKDSKTITISSGKGLKEIKYYWEGEEAQTIELNGENEWKIGADEIDTKRGEAIFHVIATDIEENSKSKETRIIGVLKPTLDMYVENNEILRIKLEHDMGFKKVSIKIGNEEVVYDENAEGYSTEITEITYDAELKTGRTDVEIKAYSLEDPEREHSWNQYANIP